MISCKEVVELLSTEKNISIRKKIELQTHLFMCKHCSAYSAQMNSIRNQLKEIFKKVTRTDSQSVKKLEEKVIDNLKRAK